jgi:hypothetical protein
MEKYDYKRAITDDIKDWIVNETDIIEEGIKEDRDEDLYNWIYEEVFDEDSVTGNGPYYYGTEDFCSECLSGNFDILYEAAREFAIDDEINILIKHYENRDLARYFDCTIRCYLLMECVYAAVEELIKEGNLKNLTTN